MTPGAAWGASSSVPALPTSTAGGVTLAADNAAPPAGKGGDASSGSATGASGGCAVSDSAGGGARRGVGGAAGVGAANGGGAAAVESGSVCASCGASSGRAADSGVPGSGPSPGSGTGSGTGSGPAGALSARAVAEGAGGACGDMQEAGKQEKSPTIIIHVTDDARKIERDFYCMRSVQTRRI